MLDGAVAPSARAAADRVPLLDLDHDIFAAKFISAENADSLVLQALPFTLRILMPENAEFA